MASPSIDGIEPYDEAAGGWGALRAVANALKQEQVALTGPGVLLKANQPQGFDCPGCAWPDPEHTSAFEFCENGAKAVAWEATPKRVGPDFFESHTLTDLWARDDHWLEGQGRLTHPMRYDRDRDRYLPVGWDEAFAAIGAALNALPDPNLADFYTSGRTSNEAAFLYQLFVRLYGTNNFPDCSNMCHEPTSVGLPHALGFGKGTVTLGDFDHCDMILSIGHNPGTNHPRMMTTLREAAKRGCTIVAINPLRERALERFSSPQDALEMARRGSTEIADEYLQVKVGGDMALLKGLMKVVVALDDAAQAANRPRVLDADFIAHHTNGFTPFADDLRRLDWSAIEQASGLSRETIEHVGRLYAKAERVIACYGMGITQHRTGTANVQQIAALLMLRGNIGRKGAGICPLRGHSNVQGDRTVGITERPSPAFLARLGKAFGFDPPAAWGRSAVETMEAARDGRCKALISLGGNLAVASSDPEACFAGIRSLDLHVSIATKLNRTHLLSAKDTFLLPCLGRTERDMQAGGLQSVTVEDSMSMVHTSIGFRDPPGPEVRSEPAIVAALAKATLGSKGNVDWDGLVADYDRIRDAIEAVFPEFADFNARVRKPGGFRLPVPPSERIWKTKSGRAEFILHDGLEEDDLTRDATLFRLTTIRAHDQYNTTIYSLNDRYRGVFGRRDVLFMNPDDMALVGIAPGAVVDLVAGRMREDGRPQPCVRSLTAVPYSVPRGCVAGYYPETNGLIDLAHRNEDAMTPAYKSVPVRIRRTEGISGGGALLVRRAGLAGRV